MKILELLKKEKVIPKAHKIDRYFQHSIIKVGEDVLGDKIKLSHYQTTINMRFEISSTTRAPILTKKGYSTNPEISTLTHMKSLDSIENFTVFNEYGSITWPGRSDVSYQNLDEILDINPMMVEMYDSDTLGEFFKPDVIYIYIYISISKIVN